MGRRGIGSPGRGSGDADGADATAHDDPEAAATCPYCGSRNTDREHPKGPSLCRAIHYCRDCEESFEAFR